jgi:hypothetical protein
MTFVRLETVSMTPDIPKTGPDGKAVGLAKNRGRI